MSKREDEWLRGGGRVFVEVERKSILRGFMMGPVCRSRCDERVWARPGVLRYELRVENAGQSGRSGRIYKDRLDAIFASGQ